MKVIGITGGVGAGKSTIVALLGAHYPVRFLHCDVIAHALMKQGMAAYGQIIEHFGMEVVREDGEIDRGRLGAAAFSEPEEREALNRIVHPLVRKEVEESLAAYRKEGYKGLVLIEAALLLEAGYKALCDEVWYVCASEEARRERLYASRGYTKERVDALFASQYKEERFRAECDFVLYNEAGTEDVLKQIKEHLAKGE